MPGALTMPRVTWTLKRKTERADPEAVQEEDSDGQHGLEWTGQWRDNAGRVAHRCVSAVTEKPQSQAE